MPIKRSCKAKRSNKLSPIRENSNEMHSIKLNNIVPVNLPVVTYVISKRRGTRKRGKSNRLVRPPREYNEEPYNDSLNIPFQDLEGMIEELEKTKRS